MNSSAAVLEAGSETVTTGYSNSKETETIKCLDVSGRSERMPKSEYEFIQCLICSEDDLRLVQTCAATEEIAYCIEL